MIVVFIFALVAFLLLGVIVWAGEVFIDVAKMAKNVVKYIVLISLFIGLLYVLQGMS